MRKFHALTVADKRHETADSLRVSLDVPDELRDEFAFLPGQHLPVEAAIDGKLVRRTYSICSVPGVLPLQLGIRVQPGGQFSGYLADTLQAGDTLRVMPPFGQFHASTDSTKQKRYLAFASGSGITPIISIVRATLEQEPDSQFLLCYGNRRQNTTMFIDDLYALKNRFPERLQLTFLFTREEQEYPIFGGRLDAQKTTELYRIFCADAAPDEAFVCGPDTMIESVRDALCECGMERADIHVERYGAPRQRDAAKRSVKLDEKDDCTITVIMDGHQKTFQMAADGASIVDAAAGQGIELPYSCKGGVCATCRTHVRDGDVRMETNYGLESWEVEQGYVLACQSRPLTAKVTLDYDKI